MLLRGITRGTRIRRVVGHFWSCDQKRNVETREDGGTIRSMDSKDCKQRFIVARGVVVLDRRVEGVGKMMAT